MKDKKLTEKMGSPSKLTPELIAKAAEYLVVFRSEGDLIPTVAGLSCYLGVSRSSIYNYKGKNQDFLDTIEQLDSLQEKMLINGGLSSDFNAAITKLIMSNHGYSEKQVVDNTSSDGSMVPMPTRIEIVAPSIKKDE